MNIIYWTSTSLVSLMLILSSYTYLFNKSTIEGIRELGFPDFFRIELAILKIVGVIILLLPSIPIQIKEWSYAGIGLFFITAIVAHTAHRDSIILTIINLIFIGLLIVSNIYLHKTI
ncbi:DoxX family protein [Flavivirga amylovorans]|uniref:DoxX family protein n=1 Tax=Flavivirga amylovorans TaxID=870486 RepID=A0ABT8WYT6_9FLAO|nr:DoxX family protein [Flavivirga amylovorans]MDO5986662.1 DoxX family protein [Flavivirga amylovorans]